MTKNSLGSNTSSPENAQWDKQSALVDIWQSRTQRVETANKPFRASEFTKGSGVKARRHWPNHQPAQDNTLALATNRRSFNAFLPRQ
ncbi:MAG: hypothetical protein OXG94_03240 [Bacteroidetes bacterium]|nr:hypothetical protein [Bacteroidota bacterium]